MVRGDKRKTLKSYNALGGRIYDIRYKEEQESKYRIILDRVRPQPHDIVLDDGCGTGLLLQRLEAFNVGLDFSHELLSMASSRLKENPSTHLVQADADRLPFRPTIFHKVFAVTLIQNSPSPEQTLSEMRRVSRKDSQIVITALKKEFSIDGVNTILESSGLTPISVIAIEDQKDWFSFSTPLKDE